MGLCCNSNSATKSAYTGSNMLKGTNEDNFLNKNFNSLIEDPHVNTEAEDSMKLFFDSSKKVKDQNLSKLRIRGLKLDFKSPDGKENFCRIEVLCETEEGILEFMKLAK